MALFCNQEQFHPGFSHQNRDLKLHLEISWSTTKTNNMIYKKLLLNKFTIVLNTAEFFLKYSISVDQSMLNKTPQA